MYSALGRGAASSFRKKKRGKGRLTTSTVELPTSKGTDGDWDLDRSTLSGLTEIGSGQFGIVYIGTAQGLGPGGSALKVAVKTLQSDDPSAKDEFLAEAHVMKAIDGSPHVVRLLGVCVEEASDPARTRPDGGGGGVPRPPSSVTTTAPAHLLPRSRRRSRTTW